MSKKRIAWECFAAKMAALGLDPLGPPVDEDHPHFDDLQAVLAQFCGIAPLPPLPPHWEGHRPADYDGTLAGIGRWLDFEWRQIVARDIFPGAGETSLAHLNEVIRNAYRAIAYFQVANPPTREARAMEIAVAKKRIEGLVEFVRSKLKSGWQSAAADRPKEGIVKVTRWRDLGIGIGVDKYYAFPQCPELGQQVRLMDGKTLPLVGERWRQVLECLALSQDGKTATKAELVMKLGYLKKGEVRDDYARHEQLTVANTALKKLRPTMGDLGRELRNLIVTADLTKVFTSNNDDYLAAFTSRHLIRDSDGNFFFRRA